jgi:hypothetical protein
MPKAESAWTDISPIYVCVESIAEHATALIRNHFSGNPQVAGMCALYLSADMDDLRACLPGRCLRR